MVNLITNSGAFFTPGYGQLCISSNQIYMKTKMSFFALLMFMVFNINTYGQQHVIRKANGDASAIVVLGGSVTKYYAYSTTDNDQIYSNNPTSFSFYANNDVDLSNLMHRIDDESGTVLMYELNTGSQFTFYKDFTSPNYRLLVGVWKDLTTGVVNFNVAKLIFP